MSVSKRLVFGIKDVHLRVLCKGCKREYLVENIRKMHFWECGYCDTTDTIGVGSMPSLRAAIDIEDAKTRGGEDPVSLLFESKTNGLGSASFSKIHSKK